MTEPFDPTYAIVLIVVGLATTALLVRHLWLTARDYRRWHDERASLAVALAVGLLVISASLLLAAAGLLWRNYDIHLAGLSAARGAFFVTAMTLAITGVREQEGP